MGQGIGSLGLVEIAEAPEYIKVGKYIGKGVNGVVHEAYYAEPGGGPIHCAVKFTVFQRGEPSEELAKVLQIQTCSDDQIDSEVAAARRSGYARVGPEVYASFPVWLRVKGKPLAPPANAMVMERLAFTLHYAKQKFPHFMEAKGDELREELTGAVDTLMSLDQKVPGDLHANNVMFAVDRQGALRVKAIDVDPKYSKMKRSENPIHRSWQAMGCVDRCLGPPVFGPPPKRPRRLALPPLIPGRDVSQDAVMETDRILEKAMDDAVATDEASSWAGGLIRSRLTELGLGYGQMRLLGEALVERALDQIKLEETGSDVYRAKIAIADKKIEEWRKLSNYRQFKAAENMARYDLAETLARIKS